MGTIFLTSNPEFSAKKENGERRAIKLTNSELVENLKKEIQRYNNEYIGEYVDKLFQALNDIEYYINDIIEKYNFSKEDKSYFSKFIKVLKDELIKCGYNFNKLTTFYNVFFSNMSELLLKKVGEECFGYSLSLGVPLSEAKSLNEILHVIHQTIINNDENLKSLPKIQEKTNNFSFPITLYGRDNEVAKNIFENFPLQLDCGYTDIVSLKNNEIIIMVRDRGHALSIEIEKENDVYYVKYFIPKICNVDMVNKLKGVDKVDKNSKYTVGIFKSTLEDLPNELYNFISKVPTDEDIKLENYEISFEDGRIRKR
jgi:hypothetical protein